jgi:cytoskeletal protein RodZ
MSMINDALKRAKHTQQENPPPIPPLEFKPVDPAQEDHSRTPLLILTAAGLVMVLAVLGGLVVWGISQQRDAALQAQARAAVKTPDPSEIANPVVAPALSPEEALTNALPAESVAPAKPEPVLQGILFSSKNPSAVVDGRTVYVHDRVNGFKVQAITPTNVILADATQTNVLSLSR